jgi:hypothetical protein
MPIREENLPFDFVNGFFRYIDYCDQSEAPPTKAAQTNALRFTFYYHPPGHPPTGGIHYHIYKGLLVYSPPSISVSLGRFDGTGSLAADAGQKQELYQEFNSPQRPSPWVRIAMPIYRSATLVSTLDPPAYRVSITAGFYFKNAETVLAHPTEVERVREADIVYRRALPEGSFYDFLDCRIADGDLGQIYLEQSTVVQ